jgi:hypothetical protein
VSLSKRLMPDARRMDADGESKATDIMMAERARETRVSAKSRRWEEERKKEWKDNKKYYMKDRAEKKQIKERRIVEEVLKK